MEISLVVRDNFGAAQTIFIISLSDSMAFPAPLLLKYCVLAPFTQSGQIFVQRFASGCLIADVQTETAPGAIDTVTTQHVEHFQALTCSCS